SGFERTPLQVRTKIKKLSQDYKKIIDHHGKSGGGRLTMKQILRKVPFYERLRYWAIAL
ncbi:MAG: myb/SANT-like DNA-binding domain-containing protein, partial [Desulfobulbaceae bacterium]|nr:myb/SANT-like DNA-binding domain-containing protein [Desulfobulbaceae bacterium]